MSSQIKQVKFDNHVVSLANQTTNACLTLNEDAIITAFNQAAAVLLCRSNSSLLGKKLAFFLHSADRKKFHINHKYLFSTNQGKKWKVRIKQSKGDYLNFELLGIRILKGDQNFEVLVMLNKKNQPEQAKNTLNRQLMSKITYQDARLKNNHWQLKQKPHEIVDIKRELANKEAMLNSIFNVAIEGIVTIDESGTIISVNKAVISLFGYSQKELLGANVSILMPLPHKNQHDTYIKNYLDTNQAHIIGKVREVEGQHKNGTILTLDLSIAEFTIDHQRYFTGMLHDVTERKHKEIEHKKHLAELAHVTRLGLMGEMASGIAHEINQPLTAVSAYSQACLKLIENEKFNLIVLTEILQKINTQSLLAGQIIHRLRDLVSPKEIQKSKVDINELIHEAVDLCSCDSKQAAISVTFKLATLPPLFIDAVQIEQVLLNLIKNGFDALRQTSEKLPRKLGIQTYLNNDHNVEIRIKDFGPGLDKAEQANIFTPFYTTKKTGMGMGLSISRSIVEAHHGTLKFNSKKGLGTTFYFILPIHKEINDN